MTKTNAKPPIEKTLWVDHISQDVSNENAEYGYIINALVIDSSKKKCYLKLAFKREAITEIAKMLITHL